MKRFILLGFLLFVLMVTGSATVSFASDYLLWGKEICDQRGNVCFDGKIDVDHEKQKIIVEGRMRRSSKPGLVTISFDGITKDNKSAYTYVKFSISGQASDIVSKEIQVGHWGEDVKWRIKELSFSSR